MTEQDHVATLMLEINTIVGIGPGTVAERTVRGEKACLQWAAQNMLATYGPVPPDGLLDLVVNAGLAAMKQMLADWHQNRN